MDICDDDLKCYEACCEYYKYVEEISNVYDVCVDDIDEIFSVLLCDNMICMYQGIQEIVDGINFYKQIFEKQKLVADYKELIEVVKFQFVDNDGSEHLRSKFNIVGFCMKIVAHFMWKLCYTFAPRFHPTPDGAIYDILNPTEASQREMKKIIEMLEKKYDILILSKK